MSNDRISAKLAAHLPIWNHASVIPDSLAVSDASVSLTYQRLAEEVQAFADRLSVLGIGKGTPVLVLFDVCAASVVAYWTLRSLGAIVVVGDPTGTEADLAQFASRTGAQHILVGQRAAGRIGKATGKAWHVLMEPAEAGAGWKLDATIPAAVSQSPLFEDNDAVVLFSSGTTGRPKAIVHTNQSLIGLHETLKEAWLLAPGDRVLGCLPFHTIYGLLFSAASSIHAGTSLYLLERFKPEDALEAIERHSISTAALVPTMVLMMLNADGRERFDLSSLRALYTASAPIAERDVVRFAEFARTRLIANYGMTEIPGAALEPADELHVAGSVGRISPGFEVSVRGPDGDRLMPGQTGEITLRGRSMMRGYLDDPAQTAERVRDGWIHTQDIGHVDAHGNIFLSGRVSELIMRGGLNISPREVEAALAHHPDVVDAFVMGEADAIYGQTVLAVVSIRGGKGEAGRQDELRASLMECCRLHLAGAKLPARIEFLDTLPRNAGGKVLRNEVERQICCTDQKDHENV